MFHLFYENGCLSIHVVESDEQGKVFPLHTRNLISYRVPQLYLLPLVKSRHLESLHLHAYVMNSFFDHKTSSFRKNELSSFM